MESDDCLCPEGMWHIGVLIERKKMVKEEIQVKYEEKGNSKKKVKDKKTKRPISH